MSTELPLTQLPYEARASRPRLSHRINFRVIVFAGVMLMLIGIPFYLYLNEVITGGVHHRGNYAEVDLKAMSSFDMDQRFGLVTDIPKQFRDLEGKEVSTIGQIWSPNYAGDGNIRTFQLVYSISKCCFSGPPLAQHFVDGNVVQTDGKWPNVSFVPGDFVTVTGKMHVSLRKDPDSGIIKSIYHIDVEQVEPYNG